MQPSFLRCGALLVVVPCLVLNARAAVPPKAEKDRAQLLGVRLVKQQPGLTGKTPQIQFPGQETHCRLTGYQGRASAH
jgi:hypothetical protein